MPPLCLCAFVADFFGCVKGGTHPYLQHWPASPESVIISKNLITVL
ncbi:Uncharacterized protein dnm_081930 [Desulfonema magnum]|uniref:Uncharacterized protein n=1 Tax=Desulfonema magnum TaxID=45655 RepID=A0A975BVM7_9BACT|nr:Uncharacterized protein dnm_081930 [Desulfonema magnum]